MNLSDILFTTVSNRLKLKVFSLNEERLYVKNLKTQINSLKKVKENDYKNISIFKNRLNSENNQSLTITYIISVSFLKANTTIQVSDIKGSIKQFYSAGSVKLSGKQKKKRRITVSKLISLLLKNATFLNRKPAAVHLNNVNFYRNLIIGKLKRTIYVRVIKSFDKVPYNGCRKKKLRRKKYTKKFK